MIEINIDPFDNHKTFIRCPSCHCIFFQRKEALSHSKFEHLDPSSNSIDLISTPTTSATDVNPILVVI